MRGTQTRRMLSSPLRRELRRGIGPRAGAPRHTGRRPLVRANKARNLWCQRPREPGCHQVVGCASARAITSFPHSTEPSPDPAPTTKDSLCFPTVSAEPLNPNLVQSENSALLPNLLQPWRAEPLPLPSHQDRALPRISPFQGFSAACWPESEDEPPGTAYTSQGQGAIRAVGVPGGAWRVRSAGGEARSTEPGGLWGAGWRGAAGRARDCSPRAGQRSGD